jgi:hypothetical protein
MPIPDVTVTLNAFEVDLLNDLLLAYAKNDPSPDCDTMEDAQMASEIAVKLGKDAIEFDESDFE